GVQGWLRGSCLPSQNHSLPTGTGATAMNRCCWKASCKCPTSPASPTEPLLGSYSEKLKAEANSKKTTKKPLHLRKSGFIRCTHSTGKSSAPPLDPPPTRGLPNVYGER